ncbi:MAG: hypothetical protein K1060chlam2_00385 [Chlamydiae bacterium]|nr:hypothetical protein [Chlamydiota bacterium]
MVQDDLTKEGFTGLFEDNFKLANYAIKLAQKQIESGNEELNVTQLLKEIRKNPPEATEVEEEAE